MARFDEGLPPPGPAIPATRVGRLLGRSLSLAKPEWKSLAAGLFFLVIASSTSLIFPQAIRMLVDGALDGAASGAKTTVDRAALFMLVVGLIAAVASSLRFVFFIVTG